MEDSLLNLTNEQSRNPLIDQANIDEILELTISSIENYRNEDLHRLLKLQDLWSILDDGTKILDFVEFDEYLTFLLNVAGKSKNSGAMRIIINKFQRCLPVNIPETFGIEEFDEMIEMTEDVNNFKIIDLAENELTRNDTILTRIFGISAISDETLSLTKFSHLALNYDFLMRILIQSEDDPRNTIAATRIDYFYFEDFKISNSDKSDRDESTRNKLQILLDFLQGEYPENHSMKEFLCEKIKTISVVKKKPKWVKDFGIRRVVKSGENLENLKNQLPNDQDLDISMEELRTSLIIQGRGNKSARKFHQIVNNLGKNGLMFQIYGPCNREYGSDFTDETNICNRFGGCRMFTCTEFENIEEFEDNSKYEDEIRESYGTLGWFTGNCDFCLKKILKPCYAVRQPLFTGGWQGCYCSWTCVKNDLAQAANPHEFIRAIFDQIKYHQEILMKHGIQDRDF